MKDSIHTSEKPTQTVLIQLSESDFTEIIRREVRAALSGFTFPQQPTNPDPEPELMTRTEVRKLFGVSLPTLIRWAKEKTLPCLHFNRCVRYRVSDVKKALQQKKGQLS